MSASTASTGMGHAMPHIPLYATYNNWDMWFIKFESSFYKRNNGYGILGVEEAPTDVDEKAKYTKNNEALFHDLVMAFDGELLNLFYNEAKKDGKKSLQILKDHFEGTKETKLINTLTQLMDIKLESNETLLQFTYRAKSLKKILDENSVKIDDMAYIVIVLRGLPEKFNLFKTVLKQVKPYPKLTDFFHNVGK